MRSPTEDKIHAEQAKLNRSDHSAALAAVARLGAARRGAARRRSGPRAPGYRALVIADEQTAGAVRALIEQTYAAMSAWI
jgi:hypothetical protein